MDASKKTLNRALTLPLITFFGLGNIIGAGIYALMGKVAGEAGYYAPLSFFIASVIAAFSALSYAELSARYPESGGVSVFLYEGFHLRWLSKTVGLLIISAGILSSAAISHAFVGYFKATAGSYIPALQHVPATAIIALLLFILAALAVWGIRYSVAVVSFLTLLQIIGLIMVIWIGIDNIPAMALSIQTLPEALPAISVVGIFAGAFLAFYAYLGFEDMVNVAEEVQVPQRTMPRAILLALVISMLLYSAVTIVAVLLVEPHLLARSNAPLALVYSTATGKAPVFIGLIGMFAVVNGALIQMVMASRLLYGMSNRGWLPQWFARIHPPTRTPVNSTLVVASLILVFAMMLPMVTLAEMTSSLILLVFILINLALIRIKQQQPQAEGVYVFPSWIPKLGLATAIIFLLLNIIRNLL